MQDTYNHWKRENEIFFFKLNSHFQVKSINPFNACTNKLSISLHHLKSLFSFFFKSISIFQKINFIPFHLITSSLRRMEEL